MNTDKRHFPIDFIECAIYDKDFNKIQSFELNPITEAYFKDDVGVVLNITSKRKIKALNIGDIVNIDLIGFHKIEGKVFYLSSKNIEVIKSNSYFIEAYGFFENDYYGEMGAIDC